MRWLGESVSKWFMCSHLENLYGASAHCVSKERGKGFKLLCQCEEEGGRIHNPGPAEPDDQFDVGMREGQESRVV